MELPPMEPLPVASEWVQASGLRSRDLPPGLAVFPEEVGRAVLGFHDLRPGSFMLDIESHFATPITVTAQVLLDEPILALRLQTSGRSMLRHETHETFEEAPGRWNMAMVADKSCRVEHVPGAPHRCLAAIVTLGRMRALLEREKCPDSVTRFLSGGAIDFGVAARSTSRISQLAEEIRNAPYRGAMAVLYREGKLYELLAEAFSILDDESGDGGHGSGRDRKAAMEARDLLMASLADPPSMEEVARHVGLSQRHLARVFRDAFGLTPFQCLTRWRLDAARALLAEGEVSVKQASYAFGYAHVSSFSQAFTRQFGYPPTWRAR